MTSTVAGAPAVRFGLDVEAIEEPHDAGSGMITRGVATMDDGAVVVLDLGALITQVLLS